tara:strand:+ start:889 stop:1017 length:129 start_codon:yes stop_codon:yes gene_type:complete
MFARLAMVMAFSTQTMGKLTALHAAAAEKSKPAIQSRWKQRA